MGFFANCLDVVRLFKKSRGDNRERMRKASECISNVKKFREYLFDLKCCMLDTVMQLRKLRAVLEDGSLSDSIDDLECALCVMTYVYPNSKDEAAVHIKSGNDCIEQKGGVVGRLEVFEDVVQEVLYSMEVFYEFSDWKSVILKYEHFTENLRVEMKYGGYKFIEVFEKIEKGEFENV